MSKGLLKLFATATVLLVPLVAAAQANALISFLQLLILYMRQIIPILALFVMIAFTWGIVKFIFHSGNEETHADGKNMMIWGAVGIFVLIGLWSILGFIRTSIGLGAANVPNPPEININIPTK